MAFQYETGSGSDRATSYRDLANKLVSFLTSRHVATVAVNAAGTGYVQGEILTLTHAGAHLDAKFEITSVGGSGDVTGLRIVASGAFGDRPNGSVTVSAGGTGYQASVSNIVLELSGGTSRCPAKVVATTNGSGVVTSAAIFEGAGSGNGTGVYSSLPSYPAATTIVGPNGTAAGSGCTITMGGSTGIIGTTGLAVTGGSGSSCTVDITLAETGWTIDERNTNDRSQNSVLDEKEIVLVGDASGYTNRPFFSVITATATSGLTTRYTLALNGYIAHNPSLGLHEQNFRSTGITDAITLADGGAYLLCSQDTGGGTDEMDFWFKADDIHVVVVTQIKESAATSDDGIYMQAYVGYMDRFGTETESPYPMLVSACARTYNIDPTAASTSITGIAENRHTGTGCAWMYDYVGSAWVNIQNDDTSGSPSDEEIIVWPIGQAVRSDANDDEIVAEGPITIYGDHFLLDRSSATRIWRKVPGSTAEHFLWPLIAMRKDSSSADDVNDRLYGELRGVYWIAADDGTGTRITNFSEDYVTIGSDRYMVFHCHTQAEPYQYIAIKVDV
jgi:hypothetical protein